MNTRHPERAARAARVARLAAGLCGLLSPVLAHAHTGERVFLQLLPTDRYLAGGALVVALTFVAVAWLPAERLRRLADARWRFVLFTTPRWPGAAMLLLLCLLVAAGWTGSRDPLDNPLPTIVWSVWWVGFTMAHAVLGNVWRVLSPWPALHGLLTAPPPMHRLRERPLLDYPAWLGRWPAVVGLAAFGWLELVYPAPQDPARLATAVAAYSALTGLAMLAFGRDAWLRNAETFSVFFAMVARLALLDWDRLLCARQAAHPRAAEPSASTAVSSKPAPVRRDRRPLRESAQPLAATGRGNAARPVRVPGAGLLEGDPPSATTTVFILLALSTVSFDGLSRTFWFVDLAGHNPLEYPGRTTLLWVNSAGMLGAFAALAGGYGLAVLAGLRLAASRVPAGLALRTLVVSIIPIAFGYHAAHYLPYLLIDAQYALRALGDPFALGWNLAGLRHLHVRAAFLSDHASVELIWNAQVLAIVGAHVVAVAVAHVMVVELGHGRRAALLSQAPMTVLMVGYTVLGLWLLSAPAVG